MTHLDLFSGIGGFALGLQAAGFSTVGFAEIDPFCNAVLAERFPGTPNYGDIKNITRNAIASPGIITAGFPCQPFSAAGKRRGAGDKRHLWPELARVMRELRPRYALFENVAGLLTIDGGRVFNGIMSDLCEVGYDAFWSLIPASAIGASHQRDRLWIVAHCQDGGFRCWETQRQGRQPAFSSQTLGDTARVRIGRKNDDGELQGAGKEEWVSRQPGGAGVAHPSQGPAQPRVGSAAYDVSRPLAVALPGKPQELWEWPRTVTQRVKKRADQLKALGNAVVPPLVYLIGKAITETEQPTNHNEK